MPESGTSRNTPWTDENGKYDPCIKCKTLFGIYYGTLMKRRIFERDGSTHIEYKIECRNCGRSTGAHRSKNLTEKEWEGMQIPSDNLKYRTRKSESVRVPNIALYREAEKS